MDFHIVADESVDYRIIVELRKRGLVVYSIFEHHQSISDENVLSIAFQNNSLLITEDKDFGSLVFRMQLPHKGVLLIRREDPHERVATVSNLIAKYLNDMKNKFSVIDNNKLRIKESS